jgi:glycosyltransferase involved in cell wall biosynthesis
VKILYVAPFTSQHDHFDSGVVGYGVTAGGAIVRELRRRGHTVRVTPEVPTASTKAGHAAATYEELGRLDLKDFDVLFMYNTFHQFAAEIRRLIYESGATGTLLAGYTHGSHWDPSDEVRHDYPMLKYADLGNVLALDIVFLVSRYMFDVMSRTIGAELGTAVATEFTRRARVVGGTFDPERLDAARVGKADAPAIVFNHSPTKAKRPGVFFRTVQEVLSDIPGATVTVTRKFGPADPGYAELTELVRRFPGRVLLGDTMQIDEYFRSLWRSHVQVSTATHESFGVSTVEAIYAGCCSLLPATGSYPEVTDSAGVYAEGELASALLACLRDAPARERTGAAQRAAIRRFLPAEVTGRICSALADGIAARHRG